MLVFHRPLHALQALDQLIETGSAFASAVVVQDYAVMRGMRHFTRRGSCRAGSDRKQEQEQEQYQDRASSHLAPVS